MDTVGIEEMDLQHEELLLKLKQLNAAELSSDSRAHHLDVVVSLLERHFSSEERLLQQTGYPGLAKQSADHTQILLRFKALQEKQKKSCGALTTKAVAEVAGLLIDHISGTDLGYGEYLRLMGLK